MIGYCLLVCLFGILAFFVPETVGRASIIRGTIVRNAEQFPYIVSLKYEENIGHYCGGSILSDLFVLSAASCVAIDYDNIDNAPLSIVTGTRQMNQTEPPAVIVPVTKIFVPRTFKPRKFKDVADIAVLMLKHSLEMSTHNRHLKPLKLPRHHEHETYVGKTAVVVGFGWHWFNLRKGAGGTDGKLRFAETDILGKDEIGYNEDTCEITQICAKIRQPPSKSSKSRGICFMDGGDPLVYDETVIGIHINNHVPMDCDDRYNGSRYTRVSHYVQFIDDAMNYKHEEHQWEISSTGVRENSL